MFTFLMFAAAGIAAIAGHVQSRRYVRARLRFVDVIQNPIVPVIAGAGAALVAAPVVWLLPVVGSGSAILFGLGVGTGVHLGARDAKALPRA